MYTEQYTHMEERRGKERAALTCIYTYTHIYINIYVYIHTCMCVHYVYMSTSARRFMHIHAHLLQHARTICIATVYGHGQIAFVGNLFQAPGPQIKRTESHLG